MWIQFYSLFNNRNFLFNKLRGDIVPGPTLLVGLYYVLLGPINNWAQTEPFAVSPPSHLDSSPPPPPLPGELPSLRCRLLHRVKVESWLTLSFISDCITALEHHLQLMWIIFPETILICFCYELLPWLLMLMTGACFILTFD